MEEWVLHVGCRTRLFISLAHGMYQRYQPPRLRTRAVIPVDSASVWVHMKVQVVEEIILLPNYQLMGHTIQLSLVPICFTNSFLLHMKVGVFCVRKTHSRLSARI